jgi:hypothetical protein
VEPGAILPIILHAPQKVTRAAKGVASNWGRCLPGADKKGLRKAGGGWSRDLTMISAFPLVNTQPSKGEGSNVHHLTRECSKWLGIPQMAEGWAAFA